MATYWEISWEQKNNKKELEEQLVIAQQKEKGEIPWEERESQEDLTNFIQELEEKIKKISEELETTKKLSDYINKWYQLNQGKGIEPHNSSNIWVKNRSKNTIVFHWVVPDGKISSIDNYLFYFYGTWLETKDWKLISFDTVEITTEISIFYNYYWNLIKSGANGIIHHSPIGVGDEICDCSYIDQFTSRNDFDFDYALKFDLYRLGKDEASKKNIITDDALPFIGSSIPEKVQDINSEWDKITSIWQNFKEFFTSKNYYFKEAERIIFD